MTKVSGDLQVLMFSLDPRPAHTAYWVKHCSVRISSSHATNHQTPDFLRSHRYYYWYSSHISKLYKIRVWDNPRSEGGVRELWRGRNITGTLNYSDYRWFNLIKSKTVQRSPYYPWRSGWWARHRRVTQLTQAGCCQFTSKWHHWALHCT